MKPACLVLLLWAAPLAAQDTVGVGAQVAAIARHPRAGQGAPQREVTELRLRNHQVRSTLAVWHRRPWIVDETPE